MISQFLESEEKLNTHMTCAFKISTKIVSQTWTQLTRQKIYKFHKPVVLMSIILQSKMRNVHIL